MSKPINIRRKIPQSKIFSSTEEFSRTTTELHPIEISQQITRRSTRTEYHSNNTNEINTTNTTQNGNTKKSITDNLEEHQAYRLYKNSGEYWNNTPKTDYTYSRHSPHRRELAPGVIAMPNMSRRSIHQNDSVSSNESAGRSLNMISLRKFEGFLTARKRLDQYWGGVDTVDQLDGSEGWVKKVLRVTRIVMVYSLVVSFWQNVWRRIVGGGEVDREEMFLKRARVAYSEESPGGGSVNITEHAEQRWYQRIWSTIITKSSTITSTLVSYFAYIYTAIAYSCVAGSKLIAQRTTNHPPLRYLTYVLLLLLIPLLLATGNYLGIGRYFYEPIQSTISYCATLILDIFYLFLIQPIYYVITLLTTLFQNISNLLLDGTTTLFTTISNNISNAFTDLWDGLCFCGKLIWTPFTILWPTREEKIVQDSETESFWAIINPLDRISSLYETVSSLTIPWGILWTPVTFISDTLFLFWEWICYRFGVILSLGVEIWGLLCMPFIKSELPIITSPPILITKPEIAKVETTISPPVSVQPPVLVQHPPSINNEKFQQLLSDFNDLTRKMDELATSNQQSGQSIVQIQEAFEAFKIQQNAMNHQLKANFLNFESKIEGLKDCSKDCPQPVTIDGNFIEMLRKYDADKTGMADYALETSGGQVISTRCTESFNAKTAQMTVWGIPIWWFPNNSPRVVITQGVVPGNCWAFQGFPGFLVIQLSMMIEISGFTMEHIPKSIAPTGTIDSAPKNFTVWGLHTESERTPHQLGSYIFQDNNEPLQYFPIEPQQTPPVFNMIELRIESNHGHMHYTCLYRFRVHGKPISS